MTSANRDNRWIAWFFAAVLAVVNCIVFWPALEHIARADQLTYLVETSPHDSLSAILRHSYSYPRTRLLGVGDQWLFRPVFYFWLTLQKFFFGYHYLLWQAAALTIHVIVMTMLLNLLWTIKRHVVIVAAVLWISVSFLACEMVIWHHISGYMLAGGLWLTGFLMLRRLIRQPESFGWTRWGMVWLTACLTHEFSVFLIGIVTLVAAAMPQRRRIWTSKTFKMFVGVNAACIGLYVVLSTLDFMIYAEAGKLLQTRSNLLFSAEHYFKILPDMFKVIGVSAAGLFMPVNLDIDPTLRAHLLNGDAFSIFFKYRQLDVWMAVNVAAWIAACTAVLWGLARTLIQPRKCPPVPESENISAHDLWLSALGRISCLSAFLYILVCLIVRGYDYFSYGLYHFYFVQMFFLIAGAAFMTRTNRWPAPRSLMSILAAAFILIFAGLNAGQVWAFNRDHFQFGRLTDLVGRLASFVEEHRREKDFSFQMFFSDQPDLLFTGRIGDPVSGEPLEDFTTRLFFHRYWRKDDPKYYVTYLKTDGLRWFSAPQDAQDYLAGKGIEKIYRFQFSTGYKDVVW